MSQYSLISAPADICLTGAIVADVSHNRWLNHTDVLITGKTIVGLAQEGTSPARRTISLKGKYLLPAFIDSHIHIESSELTPGHLSSLMALHGTGCIITDPHEITNVLGTEGLDFMIQQAKEALIDIRVMLPSCVPATSFEHAGAKLTAKDLEPYFEDPTVLGLAEVMNVPGVLHSDPEVMAKIALAKRYGGPIDGHAPGLSGEDLACYAAAGITSDHECSTAQEVLERFSQGMCVNLRQGSAARNLENLLDAVTDENADSCLFCSDDLNASELASDGHMERHLRMAVAHGIKPLTAIKIATLSAARHYGLTDLGEIQTGKRASFAVVDDLVDFKVSQTWIDGRMVSENGYLCESPSFSPVPASVLSSVKVAPLSENAFDIRLPSGKALVIDIVAGEIVTRKSTLTVKTRNGLFDASLNPGLAKLAVIERHHALPNIGLGIVSGYLKPTSKMNGAVATTVAHDSHNIVVLGDSDEDMRLAVDELKRIGGGMVLVKENRVTAALSLEVAGLMSSLPAAQFIERQNAFHATAHELFDIASGVDPVMTLSFLALPVIPQLRVTDMGLFDVDAFKLVSVQADDGIDV